MAAFNALGTVLGLLGGTKQARHNPIFTYTGTPGVNPRAAIVKRSTPASLLLRDLIDRSGYAPGSQPGVVPAQVAAVAPASTNTGNILGGVHDVEDYDPANIRDHLRDSATLDGITNPVEDLVDSIGAIQSHVLRSMPGFTQDRLDILLGEILTGKTFSTTTLPAKARAAIANDAPYDALLILLRQPRVRRLLYYVLAKTGPFDHLQRAVLPTQLFYTTNTYQNVNRLTLDWYQLSGNQVLSETQFYERMGDAFEHLPVSHATEAEVNAWIQARAAVLGNLVHHRGLLGLWMDMQSPTLMALAMRVVYSITKFMTYSARIEHGLPPPTVRMRLDVATVRTITQNNTDVTRVFFSSVPASNNATDDLKYNLFTDIDEARTSIIQALYSPFLYEHGAYNIVYNQQLGVGIPGTTTIRDSEEAIRYDLDRAVVRDLFISVDSEEYTTQLPAGVQGVAIPVPVVYSEAGRLGTLRALNLLQGLQAYRMPPALWSVYSTMLLNVPSYPGQNLCVMDAFVYMRMIQTERVRNSDPYRERRALFQEVAIPFVRDLRERLGLAEPPGSNLLLTLAACLSLNEEYFGDHRDVDADLDSVTVVFFAGEKKGFEYPALKITWSEELIDYGLEVPEPSDPLEDEADEAQLFQWLQYLVQQSSGAWYQHDLVKHVRIETVTMDTLADWELVLVYFKGHLEVGQWSNVRTCAGSCNVVAPQVKAVRKSKRMMDLLEAHPPPPFVLKPIEWDDRRVETARLQEARRQRSPHKTARVWGVFDPLTQRDCFSADLETGSCSRCSKVKSAEVQHAYCLAVSWGTRPEQGRVFSGEECPLRAKGMQATFDNFDGCITQFLRWVKDELGAWEQEKPNHHAPAPLVRRVFYWFNGGRFDLYFVLQALMFWNVGRVQLMMSNNSIVRMDWMDTVEFLDMYRILPGGTLDELYSEMEPSINPAVPRPDTGKWKAYPYGWMNRPLNFHASIEDMMAADASVWGNKWATGKPHPTLTIGEVNGAWWRDHIDATGYHHQQHMETYCLSDVLILQMMVYAWICQMAQGFVGDRMYNLSGCMTASNAAFQMFRQAFLQEEYTSPNLALSLPWKDPLFPDQRVTLVRLLHESLKGGVVAVFNHGKVPLSVQAQWQAAGQKMLYAMYDVNSMYPYVMNKEEMPVELIGVEELGTEDTPYEFSDWREIVSSNLYWAAVQYLPKDSGIMIRYGGYQVSCSYIPLYYEDPSNKGHSTLSMIFGCELIQAMKQGARVWTRGMLVFRTAPMFKEFIEVLYEKRLKAKAAGNHAEQLLCKLSMNGSYGKTCQAFQAKNVIATDLLTSPCEKEEDVVVGVNELPTTYGVKPNYLMEVFETQHSYVGNFVAVGAYITACARTHLLKVIHAVKECRDAVGNPVMVHYADTDSIAVVDFDYESEDAPAVNKAFAAEYLDKKKLGCLKLEGDKCDWVLFAMKKLYFMHFYQPETDTLHSCFDDPAQQHAKMQHFEAQMKLKETYWEDRDGSFKMAHKGLPSTIPLEAYTSAMKGDKYDVKMPLTFRRSIKHGILKEVDWYRKVSFGSVTRQPPNALGFLEPWETLEQFWVHVQAQKKAAFVGLMAYRDGALSSIPEEQ